MTLFKIKSVVLIVALIPSLGLINQKIKGESFRRKPNKKNKMK